MNIHLICTRKRRVTPLHAQLFGGGSQAAHTISQAAHTIAQGRTPPRTRLICGLLLALLIMVPLGRPTPVTADSCLSLLVDGGFEDGATWQIKNSDGVPLISQQLTHSGRRGAYLGGRNNSTDRLSTQLSLPATDQAITLRFWWQLQSQESHTRGADHLAVLVTDERGYSLQTLTELSGRDVTYEWQMRSFDLTPLAGQTVQLQFLASTDDTQITDFFIDDVEIIACAQGAD